MPYYNKFELRHLTLKTLKIWLQYLETGFLVGIFAIMLGTAVFQILARNVFETGLLWGDDLVRMAVLWITMVGGVIAARERKHISINLFERFFVQKSSAMGRPYCLLGDRDYMFRAGLCFDRLRSMGFHRPHHGSRCVTCLVVRVNHSACRVLDGN